MPRHQPPASRLQVIYHGSASSPDGSIRAQPQPLRPNSSAIKRMGGLGRAISLGCPPSNMTAGAGAGVGITSPGLGCSAGGVFGGGAATATTGASVVGADISPGAGSAGAAALGVRLAPGGVIPVLIRQSLCIQFLLDPWTARIRCASAGAELALGYSSAEFDRLSLCHLVDSLPLADWLQLVAPLAAGDELGAKFNMNLVGKGRAFCAEAAAGGGGTGGSGSGLGGTAGGWKRGSVWGEQQQQQQQSQHSHSQSQPQQQVLLPGKATSRLGATRFSGGVGNRSGRLSGAAGLFPRSASTTDQDLSRSASCNVFDATDDDSSFDSGPEDGSGRGARQDSGWEGGLGRMRGSGGDVGGGVGGGGGGAGGGGRERQCGFPAGGECGKLEGDGGRGRDGDGGGDGAGGGGDAGDCGMCEPAVSRGRRRAGAGSYSS
ncbi:unnamed protein product [Closterium sp. Yama58-4]|nr:unnamed protein product [Closterium sp. Yama58-4]